MYSIEITNNSGSDQNFIVFQMPPKESFMPLAWKTVRIPANYSNKFTLDIKLKYDFTFGKCSEVRPGEIFNGIQLVETIKGENEITFNGEELIDIRAGGPDYFTIVEDTNVPVNEFAVGLAIDGNPISVTPAKPNEKVNIPEPDKTYYVAYGEFKEGEILDAFMLASQAAQVQFDSHQRAYVTFEPTGGWSVRYSSY